MTVHVRVDGCVRMDVRAGKLFSRGTAPDSELNRGGARQVAGSHRVGPLGVETWATSGQLPQS